MRNLLAAAIVFILPFLSCGQTAAPRYDLKYVVIVTRHGVRSPTWTLERLNQYSASPWPEWGVPPGYLTVHGRALMTIMGSYYRQYLAGLGLLGKPGCADAARVFIWADTDQRTVESAKALGEGMLPGCRAEVHSMPPGAKDPLFDPVDAGVVKPDPARSRSAVIGRAGQSLDALIDTHRPAFDELARVLGGGAKPRRSIFEEPIAITANKNTVDMAGPLKLASTLTENLLLEYAEGMSGERLGWGRLQASNLRQVMSLHTAYADLMRRTPFLARARGSVLLSRVVQSLEQAVSGKPVKGAFGGPGNSIAIISGHDTNISNLSGILGLSWALPGYQPDDAPPGGALIFSLWRSAAGGNYSVRLQFLAQTLDQMRDAVPLSLNVPPARADLSMPACGTGGGGYACDWTAFRAAAAAATDPASVP